VAASAIMRCSVTFELIEKPGWARARPRLSWAFRGDDAPNPHRKILALWGMNRTLIESFRRGHWACHKSLALTDCKDKGS
jgi:hypothetical protein